MLVCFFNFAREAAGAAGTRHSLRPRFRGEGFMHDPDAIAPREYFVMPGLDPGIHQSSQGFF
jgi:hypothetical protein